MSNQDPPSMSLSNLVRGNPAQVKVWLAFQLVNQIVLPILIATFIFAKSLRRHFTLINACFVWVLSGVIGCMLLYTGHQFGPEPPKALCIAQASLIYSIPPMTSVTMLALFFQMWSGVCGTHVAESRPRLRALCLALSPYLMMLFCTTMTLIVAIENPQYVNRHRRYFYCSLKYDGLTNGFAILTSVIIIASLVLIGHVVVIVFRDVRAFRGTSELQYIIRMFLLAIYLSLELVLSVLSIWSSPSPAPDLMVASTGLVAFLFFGSQSDVLKVWWRAFTFWKSRPEPVSDDLEATKVEFNGHEIEKFGKWNDDESTYVEPRRGA